MAETEITDTTRIPAVGYGTDGKTPGNRLTRTQFERDAPKGNEVLIDVLFCGVCHSDVHLLADEWKLTLYPCVPGHEIVGRVKAIAADVSKFKVGDVVGVGCMIDSCRSCEPCLEGEANHCSGPHGPTLTYNGYLYPNGSTHNTFGGYASNIVVREDFVLRIPEGMDLAAAAPLLCPGVAVYGPLKRFNFKPGAKIGIAGIGGPGHIAIMIAKAMGAEVTAITTHESKREAALKLGATNVIVSTNPEDMKEHAKSLDHILATIPNAYDVAPYLGLLKRKATMTAMALLGPYSEPLNNLSLAAQGLSLAGSMIGSLPDSQEVLDFCAEHGILPQVEVIKIQDVNEAIERLRKADVRFRFVIDLSSLQNC
ncbi:NAD(P)-dependent alcohol dehydrogenase [Granulicella arctica]|uniref:NAD(P)-dependent alcohol dehydrogenase n=1 Tax=Granulicella arctica TaxID=940613 RepID=UPI0021E01DAF|nr:NAD(P)-dependent alcohol dehydrogenase [Granulicella arctica]